MTVAPTSATPASFRRPPCSGVPRGDGDVNTVDLPLALEAGRVGLTRVRTGPVLIVERAQVAERELVGAGPVRVQDADQVTARTFLGEVDVVGDRHLDAEFACQPAYLVGVGQAGAGPLDGVV